MRFALALAGDSNEDANFEHDVANAAILKLTSELALIETLLPLLPPCAPGAGGAARSSGSPESPSPALLERLFRNDISRCVAAAAAAHEAQQFRDALIWSFDMMQARLGLRV